MGGVWPSAATVESLVAEAAAAWPTVRVAPHAIAAELGRRGSVPSPTIAKELHLALGCAQGDTAAIQAFEAAYFGPVAGAVRGILPPVHTVADVEQRLRARLFLPGASGRAPVIDYVGEGDLCALVRLAAVRIALNLQRDEDRRRRRESRSDLADELEAAADDVELELVKRAHRERFKSAFEFAVAQLQARDRNLLRYHLVDHLSVDAVGVLHGVHRSTAARWLARARSEVARHTKARLEDLLADHDDLPALLRLIESRLDLSVSRVLSD